MSYKYYPAHTLKELLEVLKQWEEEGYNMDSKWNGYDDENIYVHDKCVEWRCIGNYPLGGKP